MNSKMSQLVAGLLALHEESEHAAEMDAGFDGGEFSGPAHSEMLEEAERALCSKFGVPYEDAKDALFAHCSTMELASF